MTATAVAPREGPILFSGPMVRAILEDRKTKTRRIVKGEWGLDHEVTAIEARKAQVACECPYGNVGDRLWVRETWALVNDGGYAVDASTLCYRADGSSRLVKPRDLLSHEPLQMPRAGWRPSIHLPRWASRLALEIIGVRVERLQDMPAEDLEAEGMVSDYSMCDLNARYSSLRRQFRDLWDSLHAPARGYGWDANPWVWVIEFRRATS